MTVMGKLCLVCNCPISPFMTFGRQPIANRFLDATSFEGEYYFDMDVCFCPNCSMFQLANTPDPEEMFNDSYAFYTSSSRFMANHFKEFARYVLEDVVDDKIDPFVVEIGCNDGTMLKNFKSAGIRHLGIEPSRNVASVAISQGINTRVDFFSPNLARSLVSDYGVADVILATNVICHIPDVKSVFEAVSILLADDGVFIFEEPYLKDVIDKTTYDQIYDEHTFLFSINSINYLSKLFTLELIDVLPQSTHGGSMRYVLARQGKRTVTDRVFSQLVAEVNSGLTSPHTYDKFKRNCEIKRTELLSTLKNIKSAGKSIVGYAATSKSTTITNYCSITTEYLDCIFDTTPLKIGRYSPGTHIPVRDHVHFRNYNPDYVLLFAYNHAAEIMEKERDYTLNGGHWISCIPGLEIQK